MEFAEYFLLLLKHGVEGGIVDVGIVSGVLSTNVILEKNMLKSLNCGFATGHVAEYLRFLFHDVDDGVGGVEMFLQHGVTFCHCGK